MVYIYAIAICSYTNPTIVLIYNYVKYLSSINFVPYDICEVHKIDNILIQFDILFIKKPIFNEIYPNKKILNILN